MISGRKTKIAYVVFAEQSFLDKHHEEVKAAPGFCGLAQNQMSMRGVNVRGLMFASEFEATMLADKYPNMIYVDKRHGAPTLTHFKEEMPVFADWYSNPEFRKWWNSKPDRKLDVVRMSFDDYEKMNGAFDDAYGKGRLSVDSILAGLPLPCLIVRIAGYMTVEFRYGGILRADLFHANENDDGEHRVCSLDLSGLNDGEELRFDKIFSDPFIPEGFEEDAAYRAAWMFVTVNWLIKSLPSHFTKKERKVRPKQKQSNRKRRDGKPREVILTRAEYDVDLSRVTRQALRHEIKCLCWGVRGHERHYRSGKVVFIKPYRKGSERDNPDAYEPKVYRSKIENEVTDGEDPC